MPVTTVSSKQGPVWRTDFTVTHPRTGASKRVRRRLPSATSRSRAQAMEDAMRRRIEQALVSPASTHLPFDAFAQRWLRDCKADWSPNTWRVYEQIVRIHLVPWFGSTPLGSIGPAEVQRYKAAKLEDTTRGRRIKPKTVANHLITLSSIFATAMQWELAARNPVRSVKLPKPGVESEVERAWTVEQARRFLGVVQRQEPQWLPLFWFAMRTGLRLGELAALTWDDVDFERGLVFVRASLTRGHLRYPKNGRKREEPLPTELVSMMRQHMAAASGSRVFAARDGRELTRDRIKSVFYRCIRDAQVPRIRFHDLRHTFGKHLASYSGASQRVMQELMGHADPRSTKRYTGVDSRDKRAAVENLPSLCPGSMPPRGGSNE